jgi:hypothetical protein
MFATPVPCVLAPVKLKLPCLQGRPGSWSGMALGTVQTFLGAPVAAVSAFRMRDRPGEARVKVG